MKAGGFPAAVAGRGALSGAFWDLAKWAPPAGGLVVALCTSRSASGDSPNPEREVDQTAGGPGNALRVTSKTIVPPPFVLHLNAETSKLCMRNS